MENRPVSINVGGEVFMITRSTIRLLPNTLLADLVDPAISFEEAMSVREPMFRVGKSTVQAVDFKSKRHSEKPEDNNNDSEELDVEPKLDSRARYIYFTDSSNQVFSFHSPPSFKPLSPAEPNGVTSTSKHRSSSSHTAVSAHMNGLTQPLGGSGCESSKGIHHHNHHHHHHQKNHNNSQEVSFISLPPTQSADLYIDRSPVIMSYILDAYRFGQLHLPANICSQTIRAELEFWKIPENLISECCWKNFHEGLETMKIVNAIASSLYDPFDKSEERKKLSRRGRIWLTMEKPSYNTAAKIWCFIYYSAILISCISFMLMSVDELLVFRPEFYSHFIAHNGSLPRLHLIAMFGSVNDLEILEHILRVFFTLEFLVRLFTCPDKVAFIRNAHNILDIIILLLVWCRWSIDYAFVQHAEDHTMIRSYVLTVFACLECLRCLRVLHLFKHMAQLKVMYLSIRASIGGLMLLVVVVATAVLLYGTIMFLVELLSTEDSDKWSFSNIPIAMWWALITMTTVGYGDFYPTTTAGYIVGVLCAITGLLLLAMPIAIVASNFSQFYDNMASRDQGMRREELMKKIRHPLAVSKNDEENEAIKNQSYKQNNDVTIGKEDDTQNGSDDLNGVADTKNRNSRFIRYEAKAKGEAKKSGSVSHAFSAQEDDSLPAVRGATSTQQEQPRSTSAKFPVSNPKIKRIKSHKAKPAVDPQLSNDSSLNNDTAKKDGEKKESDDDDYFSDQHPTDSQQNGVTYIKIREGPNTPRV